VRSRVLRRRDGFSREHGLVALEAIRLEQAEIGRDHVADAERHDVPGHDRGDVHSAGPAIAEDQRLVPDACVQHGDRALRPKLVGESENHGERDDREDDRGVDRLTRQERNDRRRGEKDEQRVIELSRENENRAYDGISNCIRSAGVKSRSRL
jgi:hypothetical protein